MKNFFLLLLIIGLIAIGTTGMSEAKLTVIGSVEYETSPNHTQTYLLIWDDMSTGGQSVVWLDYTNYKDGWAAQQKWVDILNGNGFPSFIKKITLYAGYTVDWGSNLWRLPTAKDGVFEMGYSGLTTGGYNIVSSELGHLFYQELQNNAEKAKNGHSQSPCGLINMGPFEHIGNFEYWTGTTYMADETPYRAWTFNFANGLQGVAPKIYSNPNMSYPYGLALRNATVTYRQPGGIISPVNRPGVNVPPVEKKIINNRIIPK